MPTLIRRPGSPYWIACFDVPQADGTLRRLKKSTKKKKRAEAMEQAVRMEAAEKKAGTSTEDDATAAFSILSDAAKAASRGELSEARARELIAKLSEISTGQPLRFFTVAGWREEWLAMKTSKPATIRRYGDHTGAFIAWLGDKANSRMEAITKADIRGFRDAILAGWSERPTFDKEGSPVPVVRTAKTVNHYAADVASMFRAAMRDGLILANPAAALGRLPELDSTDRDVFTVAEVGKLVETAGCGDWQAGRFAVTDPKRAARCSDWQGMILLGFYAGARLSDCARMTWGNVNLKSQTLTFIRAKTERKRKRPEIPIHPRLLSWLKTRKPGPDDAPIFPVLSKVRANGAGGLSGQFVCIIEAAKIDRGIKRSGGAGARAQFARSFHSLRHSLVSTLANADVSEEIRRRITGHDSAEVHAKYSHHERETLARAVAKMPSV